MLPKRLIVGLLGILLVIAAGRPIDADPTAKLNALIISGHNNHDWKTTTPALQRILEKSGRFTVDVTEQPQKLTAESLKPYDVIISNFNTFTSRTAKPIDANWSDATKQAYVDFVRNGKGHVVVHAGSSSFYEWPAYQQLVLTSFKIGQTGHGRRHAFPVRVDAADHPIMAGLGTFYTHDELWHRAPVQPNAQVIASAFSSKESGGSGAWEQVAVVGRFGKGRSFTTLLGHDALCMTNPGFEALLVRGSEWAATGKVTVAPPVSLPASVAAAQAVVVSDQKAIAAIKSYKLGDDRAPLVVVEHKVHAAAANEDAKRDLAKLLADVLGTDATIECKRFVCDQLAKIGSADQVRLLGPLLNDAQLSVAARGALESIGGPKSLAALRDAIGWTEGTQRIGVVASLGKMRDSDATALIAPLLKSQDQAIQKAAIIAMGDIANVDCRNHLLAMRGKVAASLNATLFDALLECAEHLVADGRAQAACKVYEQLLADGTPANVRAAALTAYAAVHPAKRSALVRDGLESDESALQKAALRVIAQSNDDELTASLTKQLNDLPPAQQVQAIAILSGKRATAAAPAIETAAKSDDPAVRRQAFAALGQVGNASSVAPLVAGLPDASREDVEIIRRSLVLLRGDGVDGKVVSKLKSTEPKIAAVLVDVLADRGARSAAGDILPLTKHVDRDLAGSAVAAVGRLAGDDAVGVLIELLGREKSVVSTSRVQSALTAICRRRPDAPARPIIAAYSSASAPARLALLNVLAALGGNESLQVVAGELDSNDQQLRTEAIRAMAIWSDASAIQPLANLATSSTSNRERTLALRGVVDLAEKYSKDDPRAVKAALESTRSLMTDSNLRSRADEVLLELSKRTSDMKWETSEHAAALIIAGQKVWQFNFDPALAKPYFDPLALPGGPSVTWANPPDHIHHYGLWFCWKFINGINYWEESGSPRRSAGLTNFSNVKVQPNDDFSARITMDVAYHPPDVKPVMTGQFLIDVSAPDDSGRYHMDWKCVFTAADKDVALDRTPLPGEKGGRAYGGYAGLSIRMRNLSERQAVTTDGPATFNDQSRLRMKADAMDYSGVLDDAVVGVAICDHPDNLNSPTPWYTIRSNVMTYFSPAVICNKPFTLPAGESFTLRYRLIVHPGRWDARRLNDEHDRFVKDASKTNNTEE